MFFQYTRYKNSPGATFLSVISSLAIVVGASFIISIFSGFVAGGIIGAVISIAIAFLLSIAITLLLFSVITTPIFALTIEQTDAIQTYIELGESISIIRSGAPEHPYC